ncbi:hypothetical protein PHYBLDRAFT_67865 [Phycomyces blakesleeanus NRRL 1555(-)]|uniref:Uncharacterized protein n=1 Tax=Phycomyces blakesleeanus (strain ATCC 8743b / DSM 1359 / FGSC 10004 / NBRC 33097 / NRRL 1555) TaxID=763407 RepID=A0A162UBY1_PHYB8|nr:hypothetical protein PHYBLDRAFT_67865 [Phycomyces blakesleeanus NRRL 1555(-)]OAD75102.1 hypothetical protein PHYBLDRAFT_67865 [Phycomyces blakesleeanus NRRL 1555(-)]|eukprot:XP_018293142.1 hypothetical protein PHYBLDRAFT_67865 [Phycomyces blakesleeanus NRRL 1555(-)]
MIRPWFGVGFFSRGLDLLIIKGDIDQDKCTDCLTQQFFSWYQALNYTILGTHSIQIYGTFNNADVKLGNKGQDVASIQYEYVLDKNTQVLLSSLCNTLFLDT